MNSFKLTAPESLIDLGHCAATFRTAVLLATLAVPLAATPAAAATYAVPGDFATIQAAIDDAGVVDGDTINVAAGEYNENSAPGNDAIQVTKELSILGAGSDAATGSRLVPACGAGACNAVVRVLASNVTFRGFRIDAKSGVDAGTGEIYTHGVYLIGAAGDIDNITVDDVHVEAAGKAIEVNNVNGATISNFSVPTDVADNAGTLPQVFRLVDSDNIAISDSTATGGGPSFSYSVVSFQGHVSYSLDNVTLGSPGQAYGQYIYAQPVGYCCDPGPQQVTYGDVAFSNQGIGIFIADDPGAYTAADFAVTLTQTAGTAVTFTAVDVPLQRRGLGEVVGLDDFVCTNGIPHRVTNGTEESYFASNADAVAYQSLNGGTVDAVTCATCGDSTAEGGEQCDDGNTVDGDCCSSTCQYESSGSACGSSSTSVCDNPDTCDGAGVCQDNYEPDTTSCRPVAGLCDIEDFCDGVGACDADALVAGGTVCRAVAGVCDAAEACTGVSADCPADAYLPAGTECRAADGDVHGSGYTCDPAEDCTGASVDCPADVYSDASQVCNPGSGDICDPAETCPGTPGGSCPADSVEPDTTECRASDGDINGSGFLCDPAESCTGAADQPCPTDTVYGSNVMCNPGSGYPVGGLVCDEPEYCTGVEGQSCPADVIVAADTPCREATGECDKEEKCSGTADVACGSNEFFADGLDCYGDPYIADPPNRVEPAEPNPCSNGECQCSAGICLAITNPLLLDEGTVKLRTAKKPNRANGKAAVRGAKLVEDSTFGELFAALSAGVVQALVSDADQSFYAIENFTDCNLEQSQKRDKYKCRSSAGKMTVTTTPAGNEYTIRITLKRLPQSVTGDGGLSAPVTVALPTTEFYQAVPAGSLEAEQCASKDSGTQILCGRNYPGPFVGGK